MSLSNKKCFYIILLVLLILTAVSANIHLGDPVFKYGATVDYLIITPADSGIVFQAQRLAELKRDRGLRTRIEVTDSINNRWPGIDMPGKIRACVQSYYADSGLTWLLLFGDFKQVPARKVSVKDSLSADWSDIYYACLEGSWDMDGNGIYGEEASQISYTIKYILDSSGYQTPIGLQEKVSGLDIWPDVYVGRLPIAFAAEASIIVDKIISLLYGLAPNRGSKKCFVFRRQMFSFPGPPAELMIDDVARYLHYEIKPGFVAGESEFYGGSIRELYEDRITAGDTVKNDSIEITRSALSAFLSMGSNLVAFCAHGSPQAIRICSFADKPLFTSQDALALTSATYSNIIGQSCYLMSMPPESLMCFAKAFLVNPAGGAVSYYGNSNLDYSAASWPLTHQALDSICDGTVSRLAPALQVTNIDHGRFNQYTHQFWGDPEMEMWTKSLSASDSVSVAISVDGDFYTVAVQPPLDSILVSIRKRNTRISRGYSSDGIAKFEALLPNDDTVIVTATRHNLLPGKLCIRASDIPYAIKNRYTINPKPETRKLISIINRNQILINGAAGAAIRIFSADGRMCFSYLENSVKIISLRPGIYVAKILLPNCKKVEKFAVCR